jgi:hypothetical protein
MPAERLTYKRCTCSEDMSTDMSGGLRIKSRQFTVAARVCPPLNVISRHLRRKKSCPLYARKQTFHAANVMSALCQ